MNEKIQLLSDYDSDILRLRDCFTAGYNMVNYCDDTNTKSPIIISDNPNILWEIRTQFLFLRSTIYPRLFLLSEQTTIRASTACTLNDTTIQRLSPNIDVCKNDAIIIISDEKNKSINIKHKNVIHFKELLNHFILYTYAAIPLSKYVKDHPGVKVILTNVPLLDKLNTQSLSEHEKWLRLLGGFGSFRKQIEEGGGIHV